MSPFCPALVTVLIAIHLFLVQRQGMSVPPKVEAEVDRESLCAPGDEVLSQLRAARIDGLVRGHRRAGRAWPRSFPWNLGVKADPFASAPAGIKPEWYFLFMFQTLKLIPSKVWFVDGEVLGILGCGLAGLFWLLLPFFESDKPARTKAWITGLGNLCSCLRDRYECLWLPCEISSGGSLAARSAWLAGFTRARGMPGLRASRELLPGLPLRAARAACGVTQEKFSQDIHAQKGLTCTSCHGGDASSYDPDRGHEPQGGLEGQDRSQADSAVVRILPLESDLYAAVQSQPAHRPVGPVPHQRARQAPGRRRHQGCRLHRLPQRPRYPAAQRSPFHRESRQRGQDLLALPLRRGLHEAVRHPHRSVCQVQHQRPPRRAGGARRSERAHLHHLPWKPWRGAAGRGQGSERLRQLPRLPGPDVRQEHA